MRLRIQCLCVDTADPAGLAAFWQSALGWRRTFEQDDEVVLEPPEGSPEDGVASRADVGQGSQVSWVVMADPDGNEFCVLKPLTPPAEPDVTAPTRSSNSR